MIQKGDLFRSNYSQIVYRAEQVWGTPESWNISARAKDNKNQTGSFADLGKMQLGKIPFNTPTRGGDHLVVMSGAGGGKEWRDELGTWRQGDPPKHFVKLDGERWANPDKERDPELQQKLNEYHEKRAKKMDEETMQDAEAETLAQDTQREKNFDDAFALTAQIRAAHETLQSSFAEYKKLFKAKSRALDKGLAAIYTEYESNQMTLFNTGIELSEETQRVLDNPTL